MLWSEVTYSAAMADIFYYQYSGSQGVDLVTLALLALCLTIPAAGLYCKLISVATTGPHREEVVMCAILFHAAVTITITGPLRDSRQ